MKDPRELFLHERKDVYYAENTLIKALPTMKLVESIGKRMARDAKEFATA